MTKTFVPPVAKIVPPFNDESDPQQVGLWQHYEVRKAGVNVWVLASGEIVQDFPTAENNNLDLSNVYPWDGGSNSTPYVRSFYVPGSGNQVIDEFDVSHSTTVLYWFQGGRSYPITDALATQLTDYTSHGAGYGSCIT